MFNDRITRITFLVSLLGHLLFLGMPGFNLDAPQTQKPEDINIVLRMEIPPLLPEIQVIEEEKKLKEEELPEPEPEPAPKPKPQPEPKLEPEPKEVAIEEPLPEPEPIVEPAPVVEPVSEPKPEPKEVVMDAPLREPRKEHVEVIDPEAMLCYQDMIRQRIEAHRRYPYWAKQRGFEGTAYLSFVVLANGQAKNIRIIYSSGFTILDNEAVSTVKRANPFPPIPEKLNRSQLNIEVAIIFRLN